MYKGKFFDKNGKWRTQKMECDTDNKLSKLSRNEKDREEENGCYNKVQSLSDDDDSKKRVHTFIHYCNTHHTINT